MTVSPAASAVHNRRRAGLDVAHNVVSEVGPTQRCARGRAQDLAGRHTHSRVAAGARRQHRARNVTRGAKAQAAVASDLVRVGRDQVIAEVVVAGLRHQAPGRERSGAVVVANAPEHEEWGHEGGPGARREALPDGAATGGRETAAPKEEDGGAGLPRDAIAVCDRYIRGGRGAGLRELGSPSDALQPRAASRGERRVDLPVVGDVRGWGLRTIHQHLCVDASRADGRVWTECLSHTEYLAGVMHPKHAAGVRASHGGRGGATTQHPQK